MKKVLILVLMMYLLSGFTGASGFMVYAAVSESDRIVPTLSPSRVPGDQNDSGVEAETVEYAFPYPGILTEHPLYFLKSWRDFLIERFITEPTRRIDFSILQSDKFFAMALVYHEKKSFEKMIDALKRATQEREKALSFRDSYARENTWIAPATLEKLRLSTAKQRQMLEEVMLTVNSPVYDSVRSILDTVGKQQKTLE